MPPTIESDNQAMVPIVEAILPAAAASRRTPVSSTSDAGRPTVSPAPATLRETTRVSLETHTLPTSQYLGARS